MMKKLWKKVRKASPHRSGEASPKGGSTRGSVASLNIGYEVKEKDLGKLHKAAWIGDLNKVKQLAKKDSSPLDKENRTPLHLACVQGHELVVQELLEWKAKTNIGDNQSRTPLMRAVEFQQEGCVQLLTQYRADVETSDGGGNTALHLGVMGGSLGIISLMVKAGASLNTRNKEGFAPLHLAVRNKMEDVCRLLMKERADIDVEDTNLRTPLMYACQDGSVSLVRLLLNYNADTQHKDSKGWSADDYAVIPGHHACSQLITDHTHRLKSPRSMSVASTPRTSLPPSISATPRGEDSIGLPQDSIGLPQEGDEDDSDNETISKASEGPESWADSPEISMAEDKKKKSSSKVDITKFASSIHISESDTDGESCKGPTPKLKAQKTLSSSYEEEDIDDVLAAANAQNARAPLGSPVKQSSWQQDSMEKDSSWGDSPATPRRKNSMGRSVSFKKDEDLSEVHDITVTESEASDGGIDEPKIPLMASTPAKPQSSGYTPTGSTPVPSASPSQEKMRGNGKKSALMDELGISDVDDISEMSDSAPLSDPAAPAAPAASKPTKTDDDWDTSCVSDIMTTPRPGILKKWGGSSLQNSGEVEPEPEPVAPPRSHDKPLHKNPPLMKAPASQINSDDESSAWDTTEAENIGKGGGDAQVERKDSVSEWDSDLEDMVTPMGQMQATPTPPPPPPDAPISNEVEAIVRQKQAEVPDSEEEGSMDDGSIRSTPGMPGSPQGNKFYVQNQEEEDEEEDDDWDSTADATTPRTPRGNAGLGYKEVNVGAPTSVSEPVIPVMAAPGKPAVTSGAHSDDDNTESAWDSDVPSESGPPCLIPTAITTPRGSAPPKVTQGSPQENKVHSMGGVDSEEETESIASWELERKKVKNQKETAGNTVTMFMDRDEEEVRREDEERLREEEERQMEEEEERRLEEEGRRLVEEEQRKKEVEEERRKQEAEEEKEDRRIEEEERMYREEAIRKEKEEKNRKEMEENQKRLEEEKRKEKESSDTRAREAAEQRERDEAERQEREMRELEREEIVKEVDRQRQWEVEEAKREEERQKQWEIDEALREDRRRREADEIMEKEKFERSEKVMTSMDPSLVAQREMLSQQQELHRIDEQFQKERSDRERKEEDDESEKKRQEEESRRNKEEEERRAISATDKLSASAGVAKKSASSPPYVNLNTSLTEQLKQRLQVPPHPSTPSPAQVAPMTGTGSFHAGDLGFDDNDSFTSDLPDEDRQSYYPGILGSSAGITYKARPIDDDALSYTSTEFEGEPVQSSAQYARDRDVLTNISLSDPSSLLKVQEHVRESRRQLEQERNHRTTLDNRLKVTVKEKHELSKKVDTLVNQKSDLEQSKLDFEAKIRSLEYGMTEEEEKKKNAEALLSKTKEQLARREEQYTSEQEAKQRAELAMRNLQIEMRSSANTIKELEEEREELQRQVSHAHNARTLQEQINEDQHRLLQQAQQSQVNTPRDHLDLDESPEMSSDNDKLRAELYGLKMEMDRQRSRFKDEVTLMGAENEELLAKNEELKNDIRLNEEALAHATMQYNIQVAQLRTEVSNTSATVDRERGGRDKLEQELESLKTLLAGSNKEMDNVSRARHELERDFQREKERWQREMERMGEETTMLKDNSQHLNQRLHASETKINSIENELHVSNTSLMERTSQLQQLRQDLERTKTKHEQMDMLYKTEKDNNSKLQAKVESMQEKVSHHQHENLSLKQQLDSLKLSGSGLPGSEANEKLNAILQNLRADSERARSTLEERNTALIEQVARLKEESRGGETRRATQEAELRRLHEDHSDVVKKLSHAEANLNMTMRAREQAESERATLRIELDKMQQRYQAAHDKAVESQARVSELVDRLEKAEHSSLFSNQQLASHTANMQAVSKSKSDQDDSMHHMQVDNTRLETELKYEKQRADMLYQDLQDSQKVRSSLEALCANLKSSSVHLEDKLGIADLERNKQAAESRVGEEKNRVNMATMERNTLESRLEQEMDRTQQLQKDVNTLKQHLKSAKTKIKGQIGQGDGNLRAELEARYRMELNRKLEDVNRFLDSQTHMRDRLDGSRMDMESGLSLDKRKLEEENNNLRVKYEQAVAQRETKEMEARRFRELYEAEMKWRMRVSDQLQMSMDKGVNLKSKLNVERVHRNRLHGSIGNLNSSILSNNSHDGLGGRVSGVFPDDELSGKIKAELDRSIAKHLEAAPHNHNKPLLRTGKDSARFTTSFTQSSHDYIDLLKRKYCV